MQQTPAALNMGVKREPAGSVDLHSTEPKKRQKQASPPREDLQIKAEPPAAMDEVNFQPDKGDFV